jgi:hypothetical protein
MARRGCRLCAAAPGHALRAALDSWCWGRAPTPGRCHRFVAAAGWARRLLGVEGSTGTGAGFQFFLSRSSIYTTFYIHTNITNIWNHRYCIQAITNMTNPLYNTMFPFHPCLSVHSKLNKSYFTQPPPPPPYKIKFRFCYLQSQTSCWPAELPYISEASICPDLGAVRCGDGVWANVVDSYDTKDQM